MEKIISSMYTPNLTYTYPGKLNLELIKPITIESPALSELFRIIQGVRCGEYLHYIQPLTTVLTKGTADCAPTYTESGSITDRQLTTAPFEVNLEFCKKEFTAICTALADDPTFIADGLDGYQLTSKFQSIIFEQVLDAVRRDIFKVVFTGQSAFTGSSLYSAIDGVFTRFFDSETAYCVRPVNNATFPNTATSVLAANNARDVFRALWGDSQIQLKSLPANRKAIWVSGSVWENYYDSLINDCCVEGSWKAGQDGIAKLYYRGIEIVPLWIVDEALQDSGNPYYDIIRHFAIYTAKDNHVLGVEKAADLNNLESCYDCRTKTTLIQGEMRFGYNFIQCDLISWAK